VELRQQDRKDRKDKSMRVYFSATMYPRNASDYRGVFMRYMVDGIARVPGLELTVWSPPGDLPVHVEKAATQAESDWLAALLQRGGISHVMRSGGIAALLAPLKLLRMLGAGYRRHPSTDIYHINWLQSALPLPNDGKPALVTVLGNDLKLLKLPFVRTLVRRVLRQRRAAICPNAEWMEAPLREAFGDIAEIRPVCFGIDPAWYAIERTLPEAEPHRWLSVTRLTADKLGPLFEWARPLFEGTARELHLFGPMEQETSLPSWVHYHGPASPQQLSQEWFPRACGLITLSRHAEGRPQVMLEAMAAGLPIIASNMPAHASVVVDGETGLLCDSTATFAAAVARLEDRSTNLAFGAAARRRAADEMGTWDDCARRYHRIYLRLLEGVAND
jgi:glycosyltransferase involved in cell wall biosynthesis